MAVALLNRTFNAGSYLEAFFGGQAGREAHLQQPPAVLGDQHLGAPTPF